MTTEEADVERERNVRAELLAAGWVQRGTRWVDCFYGFPATYQTIEDAYATLCYRRDLPPDVAVSDPATRPLTEYDVAEQMAQLPDPRIQPLDYATQKLALASMILAQLREAASPENDAIIGAFLGE